MKRAMFATIAVLLLTSGAASAAPRPRASADTLSAAPVIDWSNEARRAIVPAGLGGIFGSENYGNKFPGEAAVYMGIVHAAIFDAADAIEGGYRPYAIALTAPEGSSPAAAIATAAHDVLVGLQPALGLTVAQQETLDHDYANYLSAIPEGINKVNGEAVGAQVATAILALRQGDGRDANPQLGQPPFVPPPAGPGVWQPDPASPVLGLRLPGIRPLALTSASQFRPDGPNPLSSTEYAEDFDQVKELGRSEGSSRTPEQTIDALFWTDHDIRQWNDAMLRLAVDRQLDLVQTARMLAMAHVSGGDAMIACFDAKYHYWSWRPFQAIPLAGTDGNPATEPDASWRPLRTTPNFPEYPSAHACHSTAVAEALTSFFGTDRVTFSLDSRITGTTREYERFHDVVKDVDRARVLAGFHFRNSDQEGSNLGQKVAHYVVEHYFESLG
jgi:PAP2 superfamily